jgi:citrate lyase subunit beta/citryl-CoA lyase
MSDPVLRSLLFVPGSRAERVPKALAAGADGVIVDLEDSVAPGDKHAARDQTRTVAKHSVFVRVNGPDTEWFDDDLRLCADIAALGVIVPKSEETAQIERASRVVGAGTAILPLIETARGFANLDALCRAPNVRRVVFGSIDFQLDLGITGERDELLSFRSGLVLASRLAGIQPPVDGVTVEIDDGARVRDDALYGKRLGFGGKLCIHPKQVAAVNEVYHPNEEEIAWAKRVIEAAQSSKGAAVALDGKMIDRPVILKAEAILREAQRRG